MQLHQLKRRTKNKKARQVGRGGTRGKTSGRGTKGQNARSGRKKRPEMRDIIKKLPKLRGRGVSGLRTIQEYAIPVKLSTLEAKFEAGAMVSIESLIESGIVSIYKGKYPRVKILSGNKEFTLAKALKVKGIPVSLKVKEAIEKAGGEVK